MHNAFNVHALIKSVMAKNGAKLVKVNKRKDNISSRYYAMNFRIY